MNPAVRPGVPGCGRLRNPGLAGAEIKSVRKTSIPQPHSGMFLPSLDVWPHAHVAPMWTDTSGRWDRFTPPVRQPRRQFVMTYPPVGSRVHSRNPAIRLAAVVALGVSLMIGQGLAAPAWAAADPAAEETPSLDAGRYIVMLKDRPWRPTPAASRAFRGPRRPTAGSSTPTVLSPGATRLTWSQSRAGWPRQKAWPSTTVTRWR